MARFSSVGDLSQAYVLRHANTLIKNRITTLSKEVTTGQTSDVTASSGGNLAPLAQVENALKTLEAYNRNAAQAQSEGDAVQNALGAIQKTTDSLGVHYLAAASQNDWTSLKLRADGAKGQLDAVVAAAQVRFGDRYLLGGAQTDRPPLLSADDIMTAVNAAAVGATPGARIAALETFFNAPPGGGGFLDVIYKGDGTAASVAIAEGHTALNPARADGAGLRDMIHGLALAALAAAPGTPPGDGMLMMQAAGDKLVRASKGVIDMRGQVGAMQAHVSDVVDTNDAQKVALSRARNAVLAVDPYETASRLTEVQTQMESVYALTVRLNRLSLTEYLR